MTLATSGLTSVRPYASYDRESRCWRMSQDIAPKDSARYSKTVPRMGWMSGGRLYEHPMSERLTSGKGSTSLLPTPVAQNGKNRDSPSQASRDTVPLSSIPRLLPTPRTTDSNGGGRHGDGGADLRTAAAYAWGVGRERRSATSG